MTGWKLSIGVKLVYVVASQIKEENMYKTSEKLCCNEIYAIQK